jgi:formylglycine-generating enzyme required for sulfatase activity
MRGFILITILLTSSCVNETLFLEKRNQGASVIVDVAPVAVAITPGNFNKDTQSIVTLVYSDSDSDLATSCTISSLSNVTITQACSCAGPGVCTVGVTGTAGYNGAGSFDYTVTANSVVSNIVSSTFTIDIDDASMLGAAPADEEWIIVPYNAGGMGLDAFAVMKYEAKAFNDFIPYSSTIDPGEVDVDGLSVTLATHVPVSIADNQPWRSIDANDSAAKCESLGANYHLISNPEWMAIAREVEMQDANWTGGTEGSGCLFRGNSGEPTVGTGLGVTDSCGYNAATDPEQGSGRDMRARHVLSNGAEIYDLSGNLWEWTDWDSTTVGFQLGPVSCAVGWLELPAVTCGALADADYNSNNGAYTSTEGVGMFAGGSGGSGGAALRGGVWWNGAYAGVFAFRLTAAPTSWVTHIGFRCVYRP